MFIYVFVAVVLIRMILIVIGKIDLTMWKLSIKRRTKYVAGLFINNYVDSKVLFISRYKELPSIGVITQIDVTKAYAFLTERFRDEITDIHQATMFDHNEGSLYFNITIFELTNKRIIELGNGYAEVIHTKAHRDWTSALLKDLATCKTEADLVGEKTPTVIGFARAMQMN